MNADTLRKVAWMTRRRAERAVTGEADGMERLGATRALKALARDLEVAAEHVEPAWVRKARRKPKGT